jgi:hypothetical protein
MLLSSVPLQSVVQFRDGNLCWVVGRRDGWTEICHGFQLMRMQDQEVELLWTDNRPKAFYTVECGWCVPCNS